MNRRIVFLVIFSFYFSSLSAKVREIKVSSNVSYNEGGQYIKKTINECLLPEALEFYQAVFHAIPEVIEGPSSNKDNIEEIPQYASHLSLESYSDCRPYLIVFEMRMYAGLNNHTEECMKKFSITRVYNAITSPQFKVSVVANYHDEADVLGNLNRQYSTISMIKLSLTERGEENYGKYVNVDGIALKIPFNSERFNSCLNRKLSIWEPGR